MRNLTSISTTCLFIPLATLSTAVQAEMFSEESAGNLYTLNQNMKTFPVDGVLFGTPPQDLRSTNLKYQVAESDSAIIAEFELEGGFIRFIDEGDSQVSTLIKGGYKTFKAIADAGTVGELFQKVAPKNAEMPELIQMAQLEPLTELKAIGGSSHSPTLEQEFEVGDDDWADGCAGDSLAQWTTAFNSWVGLLWGDKSFSTSDHWSLGFGTVNNVYGYYGTIDEVWFAACMVEGVVAGVQMQRRYYSYCDVNGCGNWGPIAGTDALIGPGERYMYHNHSHYSPLRRVEIDSIGNAQYTGWEYFISGAGLDTFAPDDQYQSAD